MIIDSHRASFQSGVLILLYTNLGSQAFYFIQNNQGFYRIHQTHLHILNVAMKHLADHGYAETLSDCQTVDCKLFSAGLPCSVPKG